MFEVITLIFVLAALFCLINERVLHLQVTIGLMLLALLFVLSLTVLAKLGLNVWDIHYIKILAKIDFSQVVLQGMLCFLLFAGAMNISLRALNDYKWDVITLSIIGTIIAALVIGCLVWLGLGLLSIHIPLLWAFIFGSIIAPTDPIAALAILKSIGLPSKLETIIDGESQFNDGIGVVLFVTFTGIALEGHSAHLSTMSLLFVREVLGGVGLGLLIGFITHYLMRWSNQINTQVLISLAAVSSTYLLAELIIVSGPIACVILGLVVGKYSIRSELNAQSQEQISFFWNIINQLLNACLFILIGLVAINITLSTLPDIYCIVIAIVAVLIGRYVSVWCSMLVVNAEKKLNVTSLGLLARLFTWTGLRGALAIALVLSLPEGKYKTLLLPMVYGVVLFSILIQGLTIKPLFNAQSLQRLVKDSE